jgi:SAM-dependent methyltransferase
MIDRCLFCGGAPATEFETREMMFGFRDPFVYRRCASCGSLWLRDPPEDLGRYYGENYYSMADDPNGAEPSTAGSMWARVLLRMPPALADRLAGQRGFPRYLRWIAGLGVSLDSRIADVGSGEASVISQMSRHGFAHLWGFDPFIAANKDVGNAHYRRASIADANDRFDLVMFNHSLEHVPDPVEALRDAAARLAPGGAIVVRIPVAGSFADRHYGPHWVALDPPRHLSIPSTSGMRAGAEHAGLELGRVFFDSQALQIWGSEQYAQDIPLHDDRGGCDASTLKVLSRRAAALNEKHDGDSAGYVLQRSA